MLAYLQAAVLVVAIIVLLKLFRLVPLARDAIQAARRSYAALRDPQLSDDEKEKALQAYALRLFGLFLLITLAAAAAFGLPVAALWLAGRWGLLSFTGAMDATLSWEFLVGTLVLFIVVVAIQGRRRE
jgi:hypothetical protein